MSWFLETWSLAQMIEFPSTKWMKCWANSIYMGMEWFNTKVFARSIFIDIGRIRSLSDYFLHHLDLVKLIIEQWMQFFAQIRVTLLIFVCNYNQAYHSLTYFILLRSKDQYLATYLHSLIQKKSPGNSWFYCALLDLLNLRFYHDISPKVVILCIFSNKIWRVNLTN